MSGTLVIGGWVPKDPEFSQTKEGKEKVTFSICAFNSKSDPFWVKIMVLEGRLSSVLSYVKAGTRLIVSGTMTKPKARVNREGIPVCDVMIFASEITLIPGAGKRESSGYESSDTSVRTQMTTETVEEDLPF